jgi:hypothetical protein
MILALQFVGAVAILLPFAMHQRGRWSQHGGRYLVLNLVGSAVLTALAVVDDQWGFVLVQAVWTLAAGWGLIRGARRPRGRRTRG